MFGFVKTAGMNALVLGEILIIFYEFSLPISLN
jgi:hypothetical protein